MDYKGIDYLRRKLNQKRTRVRLRYEYYEMKNLIRDFSPLIPEKFQGLKEVVGWCSKAVDTLADRVIFDRFEHDDFLIGEIFDFNNRDIFVDSSILSAMISSCSFIYISADDTGYPRLQVIDGGNATGIIDPITNMLNEGYAVLERDEDSSPTLEAYFTKEQTEFYYKGMKSPEIIKSPAPYALLVPIIYRPDAVRPFGHSRITRACMNLTQTALRTLKRSEVSAEFYSFPQKYVLGMSEDAEFNNRLAAMSSFLRIDKDSDNDKPTVGQFSQQSMSPYIEQLKSIASLFAAETGLTLDDLGFTTNNPMSAEAIKASHENLRLTARKAQRTFGSGLLNVGYLSACVRDNIAYERKAFCKTLPTWQPIFEPDSAALGALGDAIIKINQAVPDYLGADNIRRLTGMEGDNG
ncbi:MAG: hypothetical protein U0L58_10385 [Ruminococcus sp.]|nr:hypothetical protein [Ruminococcus sp.]